MQRVRLRDVMALFIVHHRLGVGERGLGRGGNLPRGRKRNRWDYGVAQGRSILYALGKLIDDFVRAAKDMPQPPMNKKQQVITNLYALCKKRGDMIFDNDEVRRVATPIGFKNPFDATKWDSSDSLPDALRADDVFPVHLGEGRHRFVTGIDIGYHRFEDIPEDRRVQWRYRRSMLNTVNTSESNILSVGYNQRIIHDFLYDDVVASPKSYNPNFSRIRTKFSLDYCIGSVNIKAPRLQVEIDFTLEYMGIVTVFEAKNGFPADFNVFHLFNPLRYYLHLIDTENLRPAENLFADKCLSIPLVQCCYLLQNNERLRLYLYIFDDPQDPGSIHLKRSAEYTLVER